MSGSVNKVILIGHLGADPETRRKADGSPVVQFRMATSDTWRDKDSGERKQKTEWHTVAVFNEGLCKVVEQYVKKGSKVYVEGKLATKKWTDQAGVERYTTSVHVESFGGSITMLDSAGGTGRPPHAADMPGDDPSRPGVAPRGSAGGTPPGGNDMDDDIPF